MAFHPVERTILRITGALAVADAFLIWWKDILVGIDFFAFSLGLAGLFIVIGQIYRRYRDSERIALTTHLIGLFTAYSVFCALFNLVLLPRPAPPIDAALVRVDAWLGYSWPAICAWIADYPVLNSIIRTVYKLTLVQLLLGFVLLGLLLDRRRLHAAALATVIASLAVILCWALFPSGGASAYWTLAPEIDRIVRPIVDSAHGARLYRLYSEGVHDLSALGATGLIGFPSFHTVMGLVSLIAVWPYRAFRITLLVFGAFLLPGILIHGGHNLVDVIAGAAITGIAWRLSLAIFDALERVEPKQPAAVPAGSLPEAIAA